MKQIILIVAAVLMAVSAYAQYPNTTNKMRLGIQTTGDGLIYRHAGAPNWTPTGINNAWQSIDTLTGDLYTYRNGTWFLEVKGDLQQVYPVVINKSGVNIKRGEVVGVDTSQIVQGDQIRIMRAIGDGGLSAKLIMGVAATDINNDATGYVAWFGYVREAVEANIAETGVTLNVGDILYLSATEPGRLTNVEPTPPALRSTIALLVRKPNANNLTLLVRPELNEDLRDLNDVDLNGVGNGQTIVWDSINTKWIAGNVGTPIDTSLIATKSYVDSKVDSTRLTQDSILVYYIGGAEVGRDTLSLPPAGVTSITAGVGLTGGTITTSGTIAADTATVLVTKTFLSTRGYLTTEVDGSVTNEGVLGVGAGGANTAVITSNTSGATGVTLNGGVGALVTETTSSNGGTINVAVDTANIVSKTFLTNQGYSSGGVTGSGTTNTVAKFTGSTAIGNSLITDDGTNVAVGGTASLRIPSGTTAQRPGTPLVGMMRNNTTNNNLDFYTGTAWENPLKSATATGLGTAGRVFYADENGRARDTASMFMTGPALNVVSGQYKQGFNAPTTYSCPTPNDAMLLSSSNIIQIKLPAPAFGGNLSTEATGIKFDVDLFYPPNSNLHDKFQVYLWGRGTPTVISAKVIGISANSYNNYTFTFGHDGTNIIVWIQTTAGSRSCIVTNVVGSAPSNNSTSYIENLSFFCNGWAITNVASIVGTTQITTRPESPNSELLKQDQGFGFPGSGASSSGNIATLYLAGTGAKEITITKTALMTGTHQFFLELNVLGINATSVYNGIIVEAVVNFTTLTWAHAKVSFPNGSPTNSALNFRFGNDGTNLKIWVGELTSNAIGGVQIKNAGTFNTGSSFAIATFRELLIRANWNIALQTSAFGTVNLTRSVNSFNQIPHKGSLEFNYSNNFTYNPTTNRLAVGDTTSVRTLTVNGEARISDLITDTPTRIVGADTDGDLGQIRIGTGLALAGDTLNVTATGATNLTFSGASSPVTLNSDTGTDVTFTAGTGVTFSQSSNNLTISASAPTRQIASFTSSGGQVVLSQFDNEIADNDLTGTHTGYATSDFVADSSYVRYTGTDTIYVRLTAQISFLSNAVSNLIIGIGVDPGFNTITETAVYFRTATSGQHSLPVLSHIYQCAPNTKFYLNVENTTNNTITLDTFYNIQVEKIN